MNKYFVTLFLILSLSATSVLSIDNKTGQKTKDIKFSVDDLKTVFKGVLYGIGEGAGLEPALACVQESITEGQLIYQAVQDLESKDATKVLEGIKLLGQALESLPQALTNCKAAVASIEKLVNLIKSFTSPATYIYHVEKDLIVNGVQIFNEIKAAVAAYEASPQDFYTFGYNLGLALEKIFIGKSALKSNLKLAAISVDDLKTVFKGVLYGIGEGAGLEPALECVQESITEGSLIYQAVQDFETKDATKVLEGLKLLGQALESLPQALTNCKAAVADIERLVNLIKSFTSPMTYVYHVEQDLIVNGAQIFGEIKNAIVAYESSPADYYTFGYNIGIALEKTFVGVSLKQYQSISVDDLKTVFKGVLYGIGEGAGLDAALQCVQESVTEGSLIYQAIVDFETKDATKVLEGLKLLGQALESLPQALTNCKAAVSEIERLVNLIKSFTSPMAYVYHVEQDLIVNGAQIFGEIKNAIVAYESTPADYYTFGYNIGLALEKTFIGNQLKSLQSISIDDLKTIFKGVLYGIGEGAGLEQALECVQESITEGSLIYQAVLDFETKDAAKVLEGLKLLGQALQSLPQALTNCKAAVTEIESLVNLIKSFTNPMSYVYHVEKDLIVNGAQIFNEIKNAIVAYEATPADYYTFGYNIGLALEKTFIGQSRVYKLIKRI